MRLSSEPRGRTRPGAAVVAEEPPVEVPEVETAEVLLELSVEAIEAEARLMPDSEDPETGVLVENADRDPMEIMPATLA